MIKKDEKEKEKISRRLNEILIERIRKYEIQDSSQLINSPNDGDTNNTFLGGLINFDGEKNNISDYEINNDLDIFSVNDIYMESFQYNDYDELNEEEEDEESEEDSKNKNKNEINKNINGNIYSFKNDENNSENINVILNEDFNNYLDLIQKHFKTYENNHFPKLIDNNDDYKTIFIKNLRKKIYETKDGKKIIINNELYPMSVAFLKNKDLFSDIPVRYTYDNSEFTLDYNLLEENMENIFIKSKEFIEINSSLSTSMSKVLLYSKYLDKYIKDNLEPFDISINTSFEKIKRDKKFIAEAKEKIMKNSGNIILKRLKMDNTKKLVYKLKKYKNLKNIMNSLESLFSDPRKSQEIFDLINKCKGEIEKIKNINNKENNSESIIELFEKQLNAFKIRNDAHMSGELSQVIYNYFNNFLIIGNNEINLDKKEKLKEYEKYGLSKFVLEKVSSISELYCKILINLYFPSPKKELEKINKICDYYIDGNLINNVYLQLRGIFTDLTEQIMELILSIFREKINRKNNIIKKDNKKEKDNLEKENINDINDEEESKNENNSKKENENSETETTENEKESEINNENVKIENIDEISNKEEINQNDEIFILLCIILSKNKLHETIISFIDLIIKKLESSEVVEYSLKKKIINECLEIKQLVKDNIKNIIIEEIHKCLNKVSINDNIDIYINNYYLILEIISDEISNYDDFNSENKYNNRLIKIIIKEQRNFIEHWAKINISKFETDFYKSWDIIKEIPQKYQNMLNVYFSFDIENNSMKDETVITKFPQDKLNIIKEALEEEENNNDNEDNENNDYGLLNLKDGDKPDLKIKINQTGLEIIKFFFEVLKMFSLFHKECYGNILGNVAVIIISHLNYQTDLLYEGEQDFEPTYSEISMSYSVFVLIQYIYEHIKENDFFVEIAKNSKQKLVESFLEISKNINNCLDMSKKRIEEILDKKCIKESLDKLKEIQLPYYNPVLGDMPVKEYALTFVSSLKDIYENMLNSYEESFIMEMANKAIEDFFDKFEDFIFHGRKIEDENCLKQFKRDTIFLKKNLVFITILDLSDIKNRIDNINKSVLPESILKPKKK